MYLHLSQNWGSEGHFEVWVGQNNFGNKIPLKLRELLQFQQKKEHGTTVFYQWITFVLAIHAAMLRFPYMIWKAQENGYMKSFYADGQGKSIENKVRIFFKTYKLKWGVCWAHGTRSSTKRLMKGMQKGIQKAIQKGMQKGIILDAKVVFSGLQVQ